MGSQQGDARSGAGARPGPAGCERAPPRRPLGLGRRLRARAPPRYGPCCGAKPAAAAAGSQAPSCTSDLLATTAALLRLEVGGRVGGLGGPRNEAARHLLRDLRSGQVARHAPRPEPGATRTHACLSSWLVLTAAGCAQGVQRSDRHTGCRRGLPAPRTTAAPSSTRRNPRQQWRALGVTQQSQQLRIRGSTGRFDRRRPPFLAVMRVARADLQPNRCARQAPCPWKDLRRL